MYYHAHFSLILPDEHVYELCVSVIQMYYHAQLSPESH